MDTFNNCDVVNISEICSLTSPMIHNHTRSLWCLWDGGNGGGGPEGVSWDPHTLLIRFVGFFTICLTPTFLHRQDCVLLFN